MKAYKYVILCVFLILVIMLELHVLENGNKSELGTTDTFEQYMSQVDNIFFDLKCFPVVKESADSVYPVTYSDSWGVERKYLGTHAHEGCDLMAVENIRGKYKICSMTDGTVKNIGWLEQGGWRIGIESDSGIYYYYAHLDSYETAFEKGDRVVAGQILGRMGDSGYGKEPGTKGKFDVHLHVGIYMKDTDGNERAINPYWFLKQLEI